MLDDSKVDHLQSSITNCFAGHSLERAAARREDQDWLAARLNDDATRIVAMREARNLFSEDNRPVFFSPKDFAGDSLAPLQTVFLCEEGGVAYFAADCTHEAAWEKVVQHRGKFLDLKAHAAFLPAQEAALLAYARAILHWHSTHRFCGACGALTQSFSAGHMRQCTNPDCQRQHFPRTDPAIIVLVTHGDCALLVRQPQWPERMFSVLAGFVEPGETLEAAVAREVHEETGVRLRRMRYHSSQPWPFPASLMVGFYAQASSKELHLDTTEISAASWWTRAELHAAVQARQVRLSSEVSIAFRLIQGWLDAASCNWAD